MLNLKSHSLEFEPPFFIVLASATSDEQMVCNSESVDEPAETASSSTTSEDDGFASLKSGAFSPFSTKPLSEFGDCGEYIEDEEDRVEAGERKYDDVGGLVI